MSRVSVPIQADASRAVSEMDRFAAVIRKTGQEGRKFAELDFSHPEMKQFAESMGAAQKRFDEIVKAGRGETARTLRTGVQQGKFTDVLSWYNQVGNDPRFKDQRLRERHMTNVMGGLFGGTPLQPGGQAGAGMPSAVGSSIGSMMRWALPLIGLAKVGTMAKEGISSATDEATEASKLRRSLGDINTDFDDFRDKLRDVSHGLGVTYEETVKLVRAYTSASGTHESAAAFRDARQAIGFARSFGLDPSQTVGRFGRAQWMQVGGGGDAKQIASLFADAIASGDMFSKGDEVMDAILSWVQQSERVMVHAPNVADFAAMQAAMNRSGEPGLRGDAGAAILGKIDSAIRGGGNAGPAGQNFLYRILSGTGVRNPFDVQYQLEEGAFGKLSTGQTVFEAVRQALKQQYQDPRMRASAGSRLLGISMHQYERMEDMAPTDIRATGSKMKQLGLDLGGVGAESYLDIAKLNRMGVRDLRKYRDQLLASRGDELTAEQKRGLAASKTEDLRDALIKIVGTMGPEKDIGRRTLDVTVEIKNQITRLADGLLGPIATGKTAVVGKLDYVNDQAENVSTAVTADSKVERKQAVKRIWGRYFMETVKDVMSITSLFGGHNMPSTVPAGQQPGDGIAGNGMHVTFDPVEIHHKSEKGEVTAREHIGARGRRRSGAH